MLEQFMLSTIDNPFNPFENFHDWFLFDIEKGYKCCEIVDRIVNIPPRCSKKEEIIATNAAIDRFIDLDPFGIYIRVANPTKYEAEEV